MNKPVVRYIGKPSVRVGHGALLFPIDHPNTDMVSNTKCVKTSKVLTFDKDSGRLETENTVYIPAQEGPDVWRNHAGF